VSDEKLNQQELADRLGLTSRQVYNLRKKGMPATSKAGKLTYSWRRAFDWYLDYKLKEAHGNGKSDPERDARVRKIEIETELAELRLAQVRSRLVTPEDHERELGFILTRIRAKLLQLASKWAPHFKACRTMGALRRAIDQAVGEALEEMSLAVDDNSVPNPPKRTRRAKGGRKTSSKPSS
jgi:phage terminase Nu1 subunit (DNA packaging protein)